MEQNLSRMVFGSCYSVSITFSSVAPVTDSRIESDGKYD